MKSVVNDGLKKMTRHSVQLEKDEQDECIVTVHCSGGCSLMKEPSNIEVGLEMRMRCDPVSQESEGPVGTICLEPHTGRVGGTDGCGDIRVGTKFGQIEMHEV